MAIPNWLHLSTLSGSGDTIVTITADTYQELTERLADLVISGHTKSVTLPVSQAPQSLRVRPSRIVVGSAATTTTLYVTSSQDWSLTSGVTFGTLSQVSGGSGTTTISFTTTQNTTGSNRYGNLVFESGEDTATVPVTQYNDMKWDVEATYVFTSSTDVIVTQAGLLEDVIEIDGVLHSIKGENLAYNGDRYIRMSLGTGYHTLRCNSIVPGTLCNGLFYAANVGYNYVMLPMIDVTVNSSIQYLNGGVFTGCNQLTSVTLSEGIERIGSWANCFLTNTYNSMDIAVFNAPNLTTLTLPSTLKFVYRLGFNMLSLTGLTIPNGCRVGRILFELPTSFSGFTTSSFTFSMPSSSPYGHEDQGSSGYIVSENNPFPTQYSALTEVVDGVEYFGPFAVGTRDKTRTSYNIRSGTRWLDIHAFQNCTSMTGVTYPSSLENYTGITYSFFSGCTSLPIVNGVKYAGNIAIQATAATNSLSFLADTKMINCNVKASGHVSSVTLPDGVETVSISGLYEVRELTIPSSVKSFYGGGLTGLTSVTMSDTIESCSIPNAPIEIKTSKLYICAPSGSTHVTIPNGIETICHNAFANCSNSLTSVTIPNTVKEISYSAFYNCAQLKSVSIPGSVKHIGEWAFANCTALTSLTFSSGVEVISYDAFSGCDGLTAVTLPNTVKTLGGFDYCINLRSINIPNSVDTILGRAFEGSYSLASITIPSSVDTIYNRAFIDCTGLTSVTITHMPTFAEEAIFNNIGVSSFTFPSDALYVFELNGCKNLTRVDIPESVKLVGDLGHSCTALTSIYSYGVDAPHLQQSTFGYSTQYHIGTNGTLHYPAGTDYSEWLQTRYSYLGYYNWTGVGDL